MAGNDPKLGELELAVLKAVWELQPCTVVQVVEHLEQHRGCARTTVLTVMQRLVGKRYLRRRKDSGVFHYSTTRQRDKVLGGLIRDFLDQVLDGSPAPFVAYLAESDTLTSEQTRALRRIARQLEEQ